MPRKRGSVPGGTVLAETLLALAIFGIGVMAALRSEASALRLVAAAQRQQAVAYRAAQLLDSLSVVPDAGSGEATLEGLEASWRVLERDGLSVLEVSLGLRGSPRSDWTKYSVILLPTRLEGP